MNFILHLEQHCAHILSSGSILLYYLPRSIPPHTTGKSKGLFAWLSTPRQSYAPRASAIKSTQQTKATLVDFGVLETNSKRIAVVSAYQSVKLTLNGMLWPSWITTAALFFFSCQRIDWSFSRSLFDIQAEKIYQTTDQKLVWVQLNVSRINSVNKKNPSKFRNAFAIYPTILLLKLRCIFNARDYLRDTYSVL
jgi:hypothetical protein